MLQPLSFSGTPGLTPTPSPSPIAPAPTEATEAASDQVSLGAFHEMPHQLAVTTVPTGWKTEETRRSVADELLSQLKAWPSMWATVAMAPAEDGNTRLMVASRPDAIEQSTPEGVYGLISRLASSPDIKQAATEHPVALETPRALDAEGYVYELRLPGHQDEQSLAKALESGRQPNQKEQLKALLDGLPRGKRVAVLLGGPSGAGKTSLIKELQQLAGDRKVVSLTGDMYFRDVDDPDYPMTASGAYNFDSPQAMHMDELSRDIASLVDQGRADIPVYDFAGTRAGGWKNAVKGVTGVRLEQRQHLELGGDDILVIDSLHATNPAVVGQLTEAGLPHASLYLDSPRAEDRLLRRIVRDFQQREGSAERTLQYWDATTFPGEVHFVRPTITQLDPAHDLYYVTQFATDLGLSREEMEHKVQKLAEFGLTPTYAAFGTPDDRLPELVTTEKTRLEGIVSSATSSEGEKAAARRALDKLANAPTRVS